MVVAIQPPARLSMSARIWAEMEVVVTLLTRCESSIAASRRRPDPCRRFGVTSTWNLLSARRKPRRPRARGNRSQHG